MKQILGQKSEWVRGAVFLFSILIGFTIGTMGYKFLPVIPVLSNPFEIDSPLVRLNYHPVNNVIRFFFLLLSPLACWWVFRKLFPSKFWIENADSRVSESSLVEKGYVWQGTVLFFALLSLMLFALGFNLNAYILDDYHFFHEAEWLAPAIEYGQTGRIWTGNFFAHGAFYDALLSASSWKIFGQVGFGASRIAVSIMEKSVYIGNFFLLFSIAYYGFVYQRNRKLTAAACLLVIFSLFWLAQHKWHYWERRDLPVLLGFSLFLYGLIEKKLWPLIITGFLATCAWVYSIDRGAYFSAAQIAILAFIALVTREFRTSLKLFLGFLVGFFLGTLLFGFTLGWNELLTGVRSTSYLFQIKDLSDASIYPTPGFPITNLKFLTNTHTFPLFWLCIQALAGFALLYQSQWKIRWDSQKIVQLALLTISIIYYRSALSRADEPHYRYVATFALIGASYVVFTILSNSSVWKNRLVPIIVLLLSAYTPLVLFKNTVRGLSYTAPAYLAGKESFVARPDSEFLEPYQKEIFQFLEPEFRDESCFFSLASEPLWPFLLRKPSCGKFYLTWLISDKRLQFEAIAELKEANPRKILVHTPKSGDEMDGIPIEKRAKYLFDFVASEYKPYKEKNGWEIWIKK